MPEPHPLIGLVCSVTILLAMFGFSMYVDWDAKRKSRAKLAEMERRRAESNDYWAPRIVAAIQATQAAAAGQVAEVPPVAPVPEAPHNAGRRRILRLE